MSLQEAISEFRGQFRGAVIEPGNAAYDEARKVYNGMIDRRPRLIAKCTDAADVIAAVRMAKTNALQVSIRGGGHNAAGLGVCDDGLVIDLSPINYVRVDPSARTALVGAGCKWSDVDHATHAFGLAVPSGLASIELTLPTWTPRIFTLASGFITSPARSEITVTGMVSVKLPRNRLTARATIKPMATIIAKPVRGRTTLLFTGPPYPDKLKLPLEP